LNDNSFDQAIEDNALLLVEFYGNIVAVVVAAILILTCLFMLSTMNICSALVWTLQEAGEWKGGV
jgi:hypothetical protein